MFKELKRYSFVPFLGDTDDLTDALDYYLPDSEIEGCRCRVCLTETTFILLGDEAPEIDC